MVNELNTNRIGSLPGLQQPGAPGEIPKAGEFDSVLQDKLAPAPLTAPQANALKFSSHAISRIRDRGITMGKEQMAKLEKAVETAAAKGAKESLILSDEAAFIVSVKNRTVITVVDRNAMSGNVFTNIDSTVVI